MGDDELYNAGFRMMAPTHFTDTAIGGAAAGMSKGGLTDLGRAWVRKMELKNMLIDLAHSSPATLRDVTAIATRAGCDLAYRRERHLQQQ